MIYLFDIDGTLLLTGGAGQVALEKAFFELYGVADAFRLVHPAGMTDPVIVAEAFQAACGRSPEPAEVEAVLDRYLVHLPEALARSAGFRLLPGVPAALWGLAATGHFLAVATGNIREAAELKLRRGGIDEIFRCGGYGSDSPDRGRLVACAARRAFSLVGGVASATDVIVVGDTPKDVWAARQNGFVAVSVASGTVPRRLLEEAHPDRLISTLDELLP